jgi:hypothetical protein
LSDTSDTSDLLEHGRQAKEQGRHELLQALTRSDQRDTSDVLDDDELLDRLADRVIDRLEQRIAERQEGASSST